MAGSSDVGAAGPSEALRTVMCATRDCGLHFQSAGHIHCCADCRRTRGQVHSRRCRRNQRAERAAQLGDASGFGNTFFVCGTLRCYRLTSGLHLHCCSDCAGSFGRRHTQRCQTCSHRHRAQAGSNIPAAAPIASVPPALPTAVASQGLGQPIATVGVPLQEECVADAFTSTASMLDVSSSIGQCSTDASSSAVQSVHVPVAGSEGLELSPALYDEQRDEGSPDMDLDAMD